MRLSALPARGFTLIELLISLAIFGLLLLLGIPSYFSWLADSQISNAAESIAGGVRFAQAQAVTENQSMRFVLDPTAVTGGWTVLRDSDATQLRQGVWAEGAEKANFAVTPAGTTTITFNGLGRIVSPNTDASLPWYRVIVTNPLSATSRTLWVLVGTGGGYSTGVKICLPPGTVAATDTMGCPT